MDVPAISAGNVGILHKSSQIAITQVGNIPRIATSCFFSPITCHPVYDEIGSRRIPINFVFRLNLFPLYSLAILLVLVCSPGITQSAGTLYGAIVLINGILLTIVCTEISDVISWFIVFEAAVITVISCLTVEGRSFRRVYAFLTMLLVTFIGAIGVYSGTADNATVFSSSNQFS